MIGDNRLKLLSVMKKINIVVLILYLLMYLLPLGPYDAKSYIEHTESSTFTWERMHIAAVVGGATIMSIISYVFLKKNERERSSVVVLISGIIQLISILAPYPFIGFVIGAYGTGIGPIGGIGRLYHIYNDMLHMGKYFPTYMIKTGIVIFCLIGVMNLILISISLIQIIICKVKKIKKYDDYDLEAERVYTIEKFKLRRFIIIVNIIVSVMFAIILTVVSMGSFLMLESYTLPIVLFLTIFCNLWIKKGKWLPVIFGYILSAHIVYSGLNYILEESIVRFFSMFIDSVRTYVIIGICGIFVVGAFITEICWLTEHIQMKKKAGMM